MAQDPPLFEGANPLRKSKDKERAVSFFEESEGKVRCLESEEEARLLAAASEPIRSMIVVGINCGLRLSSEGLTLQWESVDLARRRLTILSAYSKNKRPRTIPSNTLARDALAALKAKALGPYVFEAPMCSRRRAERRTSPIGHRLKKLAPLPGSRIQLPTSCAIRFAHG
jgi:integrase